MAESGKNNNNTMGRKLVSLLLRRSTYLVSLGILWGVWILFMMWSLDLCSACIDEEDRVLNSSISFLSRISCDLKPCEKVELFSIESDLTNERLCVSKKVQGKTILLDCMRDVREEPPDMKVSVFARMYAKGTVKCISYWDGFGLPHAPSPRKRKCFDETNLSLFDSIMAAAKSKGAAGEDQNTNKRGYPRYWS